MLSTAQSERSDDTLCTSKNKGHQHQLFFLHISMRVKRYDVCGEDVSTALKMAATLLECPETLGIPIELINTHSLQIGGANPLALLGFSDTYIQKLECWRGTTFKEYIREQLVFYLEGVTTKMKHKFKFVNVHGSAYHNVTSTCVLLN
jgi:hypothetical protein